MTNKNRAMKAINQLGETLPNGSNIVVFLRLDNNKQICHKFNVKMGKVHHSESHSNDFVEVGRGEILEEKSNIRWPA